MENKDVVQPVEENLEAQTLQPELVAETAKEEVAQQAEQKPAEQTQQVAEQGFRPNKKQTAVAVLFVTAQVLSLLINLFIVFFPNDNTRLLVQWLPRVLALTCWFGLAFMAVNKAVKVASLVGAGVLFISFASVMPQLIMNKVVMGIVVVLSILGYSYLVSLIHRNGRLSANNRTWVNVLPLVYIANAAVVFAMLFGVEFTFEHWFQYSTYYTIWYIFLFVMETIACWKLARCEAFAGKYDAEAETDFRPLNKWVVMAIVVPIITAVALVVIYSNTSWFI